MKYYLTLIIVLLTPLRLFGNCNCGCGSDCSCKDNWSFKIAPYIWGAAFKGKVATLPPFPPVSVDINFAQILRHMDAALMLAGEARRGPISLAADIMYVSLSGSASFPDPRFSNVTLDVKYWVGTASIGYDIIRTNCLSAEVLLGARIWSVSTGLTLGAGLLPGRSIERKQKWMDPLVGLRGAFGLDYGFSLEGRGIIGGFNVSSKLFWDVYGALGYTWDACCAQFELLAGYRWMSVDYKNGDYIFDVRQFGPLLGLVIAF